MEAACDSSSVCSFINPNLLEPVRKKQGTALDLFMFHCGNASFALVRMQNVMVSSFWSLLANGFLNEVIYRKYPVQV